MQSGGVLDAELRGQGGDVPPAGHGQLAVGPQDLSGDHGLDEVAPPRALGAEQLGEAELAHGLSHGLDVPLLPRVDVLEEFVDGDEFFALEDTPHRLDLVLGQPGEIGDGALLDLLAVAPTLAEQDGRWRIAVGNVLDVHGNIFYR